MKKILALLLVLLLVLMAVDWRQLEQVIYVVLRATVRSVPVLSSDEWQHLESEHFLVYFRLVDSSVAPSVSLDLEESLRQLQQGFGGASPTRIPVFIQPSMAALQSTLGGSYGPTLGAYQLGRLQLLSPLAWRPELGQQAASEYYQANGPITHELVHLLLDYQVAGNAPVWFSEGLAQFWEQKLRGSAGEDNSLDWYGSAVSVQELANQWSAVPEDTAYGESLAVVQYLYATYGAGQMGEIITLLGHGSSLPDAIQDCLTVNLDQLDLGWRTSLGY